MTQISSKDKIHVNDKFQFIIAIVIIVAFLVFLGWIYPNKQDDAVKMISTLEGFVGMIIGFYFGQRPVQNLTQQVARSESQKDSLKGAISESRDTISDDSKMIEYLQEQIKLKDEIISNLKTLKSPGDVF